MLFRAKWALGNWIYRNISRIWCETFLPEKGSNSDHPADLLAFAVIVYLALRSNAYRLPMPSLLKTIAQDATYYFLMIFTSHLLLELTLLLGKVRIMS